MDTNHPYARGAPHCSLIPARARPLRGLGQGTKKFAAQLALRPGATPLRLVEPVGHFLGQIIENMPDPAGEGFFDYDELSENISEAFARQLRAIQGDCTHPLRLKLDEHLLGFARKVTNGVREAVSILEHLQMRMVENAEPGPLLARILAKLQDTLKAQLADPNTHLSQVMDRLLEGLLRELRDEPQAQARLDGWARHTILDITQRYHGVIGEMVGVSLAKLSNGDLVAQIEEKVGRTYSTSG